MVRDLFPVKRPMSGAGESDGYPSGSFNIFMATVMSPSEFKLPAVTTPETVDGKKECAADLIYTLSLSLLLFFSLSLSRYIHIQNIYAYT